MTCKVPWCIALRQDQSDSCFWHTKYPFLHPAELEPEELEALGEMEMSVYGLVPKPHLPECTSCSSTGECGECEGTGQIDCTCNNCQDTHDADCDKCDGTGECPTCAGTGDEKDRIPPALRPTDYWRWDKIYRYDWRKLHVPQDIRRRA